MKKIYLFVTLSFIVLLLQECKKDSITETSSAGNHPMSAIINDTTWNSDTVTATVTYNAATHTKVFACLGVANDKEVRMSVSLGSTQNTAGFPLGTYNVNNVGNVAMILYTSQLNGLGHYVLTPFGTVGPGFGNIAISSIDSVKKIMSGTFACSPIINNYDDTGTNIISVTRANVTVGVFTNMPYSFISN